MISCTSIVEQAVDLDARASFVKEVVVTRVRGSGGADVPLAMIRKRHAPARGGPAGGTLAPVLLVHGYGQNRYTWHLPARSLSNYLARAGFDVFNLDLRGQGRSRSLGARQPEHVAQHACEDIPAAVEEVQRLSGKRAVYYIGHSMGGLVGYAAAPALAGALAGLVTLGSPYHFGRGSWTLGLAGRALLMLDRCLPIGRLSPSLWPLGALIRLSHAFTERPLLPLPFRGYAVGSMERVVLAQHLSLAMDAGSVTVLKHLFLGGAEARRSDHRVGGILGHMGTFERVDVPLLVVAGARDDLAPVASVKPAFEQSRSRDKTLWVFPRGHIDLIMGRAAPTTVWPLLLAWMSERVRTAASR